MGHAVTEESRPRAKRLSHLSAIRRYMIWPEPLAGGVGQFRTKPVGLWSSDLTVRIAERKGGGVSASRVSAETTTTDGHFDIVGSLVGPFFFGEYDDWIARVVHDKVHILDVGGKATGGEGNGSASLLDLETFGRDGGNVGVDEGLELIHAIAMDGRHDAGVGNDWGDGEVKGFWRASEIAYPGGE